MDFDPSKFRAVPYGPAQLYFDRDGMPFHEYFGHKQKTVRFPYYRNILGFVEENPGAKIYFTLNDGVPTFRMEGDCIVVNMRAYQQFCLTIGTKTSGRFKAFIGQNIGLSDVPASKTEKSNFVRENATSEDVLAILDALSPEIKNNIIASLSESASQVSSPSPAPDVSREQFLGAFSRFLADKDVQKAFLSQLPKMQVDLLKSHIKFLRENLDKSETFIQNWLDEEGGKYRRQRCLIFGLEYVDPVREGQVAGKQFDILAEQDLEHYVIFELKSPRDNVFKVIETPVVAGGISSEYHLSPQLSRAIPEILGYKKMYESAQSEELQKLGVKTKKPISKCVIVLGTRKDDSVWKENFERLRNSLSGIELLTYDHLIDRLENTVRNLEEHASVGPNRIAQDGSS